MTRPSLDILRQQAHAGPPYDAAWLEALRGDGRRGAQALLERCLRRQGGAAAETARIEALTAFERLAAENGFARVAGVDEAGRGPLAGPIVAAAVVLAAPVAGLRDSKQLSAAERARLFETLHAGGHAIGVAAVEAEEIDALGIQAANYRAMAEAAASIDPAPDFLLVDGFSIAGCAIPQRRIVKGDQRSLSIAAASIVAKVTRDRRLDELDAAFPEYGFAQHKGYATRAHLDALARLGPCPAHRRSFAPLAPHAQTQLLF